MRAANPNASCLVVSPLDQLDWRDPEHLTEIRITIGTPDDTAAILTALKEILLSPG